MSFYIFIFSSILSCHANDSGQITMKFDTTPLARQKFEARAIQKPFDNEAALEKTRNIQLEQQNQNRIYEREKHAYDEHVNQAMTYKWSNSKDK